MLISIIKIRSFEINQFLLLETFYDYNSQLLELSLKYGRMNLYVLNAYLE